MRAGGKKGENFLQAKISGYRIVIPGTLKIIHVCTLNADLLLQNSNCDVELVTVEASSETYGCTIISIQNNTVSLTCMKARFFLFSRLGLLQWVIYTFICDGDQEI